MGGAVVKLSLKGQQDQYLTSDPEINFLVREYYRHVDFSIDQIKIHSIEDVNFGKKITINIPRKADFINKIYFSFTLPELVKTSGTYAAWTNSIGHAIIDYVELEIGGYKVDKHYGLFLEIWEELTGEDKNENLLIGKISNIENVQINAEQESKYFVGLKFWFCKDIGSSFPLMNLDYHDMKIVLKLKNFEECVIYDGPTPPSTVRISDSYFLADYIYLEDIERIKIKSSPIQMLIEQVQYKDVQGDDVGSVFKTDIPFNHPVKELLWVFIEDLSIQNNDWFNFSQRNPIPHTKVYSLMKNCTFWVDGKEYEERKDEIIYRIVNSDKFHKNTTDKHIYIISFCDKPEQWQPSGTLNFSRIDEAVISGDMRLSATSKMFIFGINYNWLSIENGISMVRYIS